MVFGFVVSVDLIVCVMKERFIVNLSLLSFDMTLGWKRHFLDFF